MEEDEEEEDEEEEYIEPKFITMNTPLNPNYDPMDPNSNKYIPYEIRPKLPYQGMKGVDVYVNVPTEIKQVPQETKVVLKEDGVQVDIPIQDPVDPSHTIDEVLDITGTVNKNVIAVGQQGEQLVSLVTNLNNSLNQLNRELNSSIDDLNAEFNKVGEVTTKMYDDVKATSDAVETIIENQQQIQNKITTFEPGIVTRLGNIDERLARNTLGLRNLSLQMAGEFYDQYADDVSNKRKKNYQPQIHNVPTSRNFVFEMPEDLKQKQKDEENQQNNQNNQNNNMEEDNNGNSSGSKGILIKRFKGSRGEDVSRPLRGVYYDVQEIGIDDVNRKYNEKNYGMFDVQNVNEIRLLDIVTLNITENDNDYEWDIVDNYIDTPTNIDQEYPNGFNPLGVKRFKLNIDVQTNRLKDMNEWEQLSTYAFNTNNTALIKYDPNNLIEPQEVRNRNLVLDEYQGDGKTIYDPNEKIFINNHKYTFAEENEEYDENIEGFKSVMQTTIVPIMDKITIPKITSNKTLRYSIQDFNNIYSLTPGSENTYRNDFVGFNSIEIPVEVNNKVVPLTATQDGLYNISDYDPTAIGFSSVQVTTTTRSSGGGDSGSGSVKNLQNYVFKGNTVHPYTIREYNNSQYPPTDYTGFDAIIVDTNNDLEVLDVDVNKLGKYTLTCGDVENIMPVMNTNTTDDIVLSGTPQWNNNNLTWYRLFDGNTIGENGFHSSSSISEGYLKIQFLNEKKSFNYFNCYAYSGFPGRAPTHIVVEGSDDDDAYIELFNGNIDYVDLKSLQNVLINTGEYYYYKFTFSYSDGKSDYIEFTELQLMEYSNRGYKGVNINVDLDNLMLSHSKTVENIENNTSNTYYPFDTLTSIVPVMNSYNSTGASIIDVVGNARNLNNFFDGNMYGSWVYLDSDDVSFVLSLDNPIIPRSILFTFYYSKNNTIGEIKIYGSNDNINYDDIFKKINVFDESYFLKNEDNYIYENIENDNSYNYLKFELKRNLNGNVSYAREIRIFDVDKYLGFDKFTIINNTYSKTSDPVVNNLDPNNQRVYVDTDNSNIHPYVRRNWMSIPLEDKVIDYVGNYIPGSINVSSGYYGIRSVTFNNTGNNTVACTNLIPVQTDNSNCDNGHLIINDFDVWFESSGNVQNSNDIWNYFSDWDSLVNGYIWFDNDNEYVYISKTYPFILNEILVRQRYMDRDVGIVVFASKDKLNYVEIFRKTYNNSYNTDNKRVMYFDNKDYYLSYKIRIVRNSGSWNYIYKFGFNYCGDININSPLIYPNYTVNLNQPGTYYYNKPEGYDGINNFIVNYSTGEPVNITKTITEDGQYTILPPDGKVCINRMDLNVQCVRNEDVNVYNTITESGRYVIPEGFTGFNSFYVDVEPPLQQNGLSVDRFYNVNQNATVMVRDMTVLENRGTTMQSWRIQLQPGYSVGIASFFLLEKEIRLLCIEINNQSSRAVDEQWYTNFPSGPNAKLSKKQYYKLFTPYQDSNLESHIQALYGNTIMCDMVLTDLVINDSNYSYARGLNATHIIQNDPENPNTQITKQLKYINVPRENVDIPKLNIKYFCNNRYTKYIYDRLNSGPYRFGQNGNEGWTRWCNYWCYKIDEEAKKIYWRQMFFNVYTWELEVPYFDVPAGWKYAKSEYNVPGYYETANVFDNLNNVMGYSNTGTTSGYNYGEIDIQGKYIYRIVEGVADWIYIEPFSSS